jgi:death-on-curing protein
LSPRFLTLPEVLEFHQELIAEFGGSWGIRDFGLAESAIAMPQAGTDGQYFHKFPFEMAAAYLYHVAQNHPFVDGNKRTAFACALTFLELNGYPILGGEADLEALTREVASGKLDKGGTSTLLEKIYNEHRKISQ